MLVGSVVVGLPAREKIRIVPLEMFKHGKQRRWVIDVI
jgi:hypothetical protein